MYNYNKDYYWPLENVGPRGLFIMWNWFKTDPGWKLVVFLSTVLWLYKKLLSQCENE